MRFQIDHAPAYGMLTVELEPGEAVRAEPGAMVAQQNVQMRTGMPSGLVKGFRRVLGGESFFQNTFTGGVTGGWVKMSPAIPGDVRVLDLNPGQRLFIQGSSYLGSTTGVVVDSKFQGMRGLFSGESMFFLRVEGNEADDKVFYNCYGAMESVELVSGDELVVDTGHVVAFTEGVSYDIGKVGGLGSLLVGGEGLVMKFKGRGVVWMQTRSLRVLADSLRPFLNIKK